MHAHSGATRKKRGALRDTATVWVFSASSGAPVTQQSVLPATGGMWHPDCETLLVCSVLSLEGIFSLPPSGLTNPAADPESPPPGWGAASAGSPVYGSDFYQSLPAKAQTEWRLFFQMSLHSPSEQKTAEGIFSESEKSHKAFLKNKIKDTTGPLGLLISSPDEGTFIFHLSVV